MEKAFGYNKQYMDGLTKTYGIGGKNSYQFTGKKCVPGCKNFVAYETYHHKDCPFYSGSLSEQFDNLKFKLENNG